MRLIQAFKNAFRGAAILNSRTETRSPPKRLQRLPHFLENDPALESTSESATAPGQDQSGVALFMVIAAMTILSVLVTEFTYVAQVNQRMAYDGVDQIKAFYLAKTGLKISLLRLKAYQQVKNTLNQASGGGGAATAIPKGLIDKIWSFPFFYPIPVNVPGLSGPQKDSIKKFQDESSLDGSFTALIESESSKYNLNSILGAFAPDAVQPSPGPSASANPNSGANSGGANTPNPGGSPNPKPSFDPTVARDSLSKYIQDLLHNKSEADEDFAEEYRDLRFEDLMDGIFAWADKTYERKSPPSHEQIPAKKAPFYSVSELHMIPPIDDKLYELLSQNLTATTTPGINVNTMKDGTLKALVPQLTKEEVEEFFKYRDSVEEDHNFKTEEDFYKYLQGLASFKNDAAEITRFKDSLNKRGIRIVTDETTFKITVQAQVKQATRTIEAWVLLGPADKSADTGAGDKSKDKSAPSKPPLPPNPNDPTDPNADKARPSSGLKITFMKIS